MQPSSKCALSKACCCSWGNLREGLVVLSCRRRPPSLIIPTTPHLSSRACTPIPSVAACLAACVAGLVRDLGSHQGPALREDRATRLSALRTLSVSSRSLVRSFGAHQTRPDQHNTHTGMRWTLFLNSGSTLCQSREFRTPRPITICFLAKNAQSTIYYIIVYQPRGAQTDILICTCSTCPRHLALSLVLQYPQSKLGEVSQSANSVNRSVSLHVYSQEPHCL